MSRLEEEERGSMRQVTTHPNPAIAELQVSLYQRIQQRIGRQQQSVTALTEQNEAVNHALSKCRGELEELRQRHHE